MLVIDTLSYAIDGKPLFEEASVRIPLGHKVGIVGRNGTGKTTLFDLIRGTRYPDQGEISLPPNLRIGAVAQEAPASDQSLLETVLAADHERLSLLTKLESETDPETIALAHTRLADIGAYSAEARAASILAGLGFDAEAQARPCKDFSGGWRMRVALAAILFSEPDYLLLDEPTNYLDLEGALWLEHYLASYPHSVLLISHDRALLNRAAQSILHLSDRKLTLYTGNFDQFDATRRMQLAQNAALARKQARERAHLQSFVDRFRAKASKAKQAQSRLKMIERMEPIAESALGEVAGFHLPEPSELSAPILRFEDVSVGYGARAVLSRINLRLDPDDRIALIGANGQGKSTFAKLLTGALTPMGGTLTRAPKLTIGYFAQHQLDALRAEESPLAHLTRLRPTIAQSKLRAMLAQAGLMAAQVEVKVAHLSGGQKARLALMLATLDAPHLLVLDEPTNHLDMESRVALMQALGAYRGAVVLVSHDPYLITGVADQLWRVKDGEVAPYANDIEAYQAEILRERGRSGGADESKGKPPSAKTKSKPASDAARQARLKARAELRKCEDRIEKIEAMRATLDARMADPAFYQQADAAKIEAAQRKHAEILAALTQAEALWEQAQDALDHLGD